MVKWKEILIGTMLLGISSVGYAQSGITWLDASNPTAYNKELSHWYQNDYLYKKEETTLLEIKNKYARDSAWAAYRLFVEMPLLYPVGTPVYSFTGGAYDNVYWMDKNGNSLGMTMAPTYYANNQVHTGTMPYFSARDSFNPWGATNVTQALWGGLVNYAFNGFKTPNYKTQKVQYNPSMFNPQFLSPFFRF
jgi:hypothetical protein